MIYYDIIQTFLHFLDHFRPHPIPQKEISAGRRAATTGVGGAGTRAGRRYMSHGKWYGYGNGNGMENSPFLGDFVWAYRLECFFLGSFFGIWKTNPSTDIYI